MYGFNYFVGKGIKNVSRDYPVPARNRSTILFDTWSECIDNASEIFVVSALSVISQRVANMPCHLLTNLLQGCQ
jgi:hypothetical protein